MREIRNAILWSALNDGARTSDGRWGNLATRKPGC